MGLQNSEALMALMNVAGTVRGSDSRSCEGRVQVTCFSSIDATQDTMECTCNLAMSRKVWNLFSPEQWSAEAAGTVQRKGQQATVPVEPGYVHLYVVLSTDQAIIQNN